MTGLSRRTAVLLLPLLATGCVVVGGDVPSVSGATGPAPQSAPAGGAGAPAEDRMARDVLDRVNAEREARGLAPVSWNDELAGVAREWSAEMADTGTFEHQDIAQVLRSGELAGFTSMGENIFSSTGPVPAGTIHAGWMRSDSHRVNVLNPGWDRLGVGVVCAGDGSVWATQEFGRTAGADLPAVASETPPAEPLARPEDDGPSCG
jgi:uncharacterized protein YkwD